MGSAKVDIADEAKRRQRLRRKILLIELRCISMPLLEIV